MSNRGQPRRSERRGAVAVEFAVILPFLMATVVGLIELTRVYDAMDRSDILQEGQSSNAKLIEDVTNFMASSGVSPDDIEVTISGYDNPGQSFDLDDPLNDLKLFEVEVSVPFSSVSYTPVSEANDYTLSAKIVFRNGRATLSE